MGVEAAIGRLEKKSYLQVREHNRILHPTISIGSVQFDPQNIGSVDEILVQADKRMYRRKLVKMVSPPR